MHQASDTMLRGKTSTRVGAVSGKQQATSNLRGIVPAPRAHCVPLLKTRALPSNDVLTSRTTVAAAKAHETRRDVRVHAAAAAAPSVEVLRKSRHDAGVIVEVRKVDSQFEVDIQADPVRPMVLHWGVNDWTGPAEALWPPNTRREGDKACQTTFPGDGNLKMVFPEATCPSSICFVLKETQPEAWINDGGTDFRIQLKPPGMSSVAEKVFDAESKNTHWSLFNRFCLAIELMDAADAAGPEGMSLVYTWLRLSSIRQLDWYRNSNYQSKDIAHVQKTLTERVCAKARGSKEPLNRMFARMAVEGLPRGGGNGDDIRMGILHIMRAHGIKEGHRPGIDEKFLEQWHQKLHTNTTPDDIAICEAYLAFLHSNNHDDYWRVLWDVGRLTKDDLKNFGKPITAWPMHLPHLIDPFKHYRWLLKVTHSGADLDTAAEFCKGYLDDELKGMIYEVLGQRNEWWVPGKIVEIRERLSHYWKGQDSSRDILLLDIALENWFKLGVDKVEKSTLQGDDLVEMVGLVLRNALITVDDTELNQVAKQWDWVRGGSGGRWSKEWSLATLGAVQRAELSLAAYMDGIYNLVQPHADKFGEVCNLDKKYIANFGEEVVRGRPLFALSQLLQTLEPMLRTAAGVSSWQVVSNGVGPFSGALLAVPSLADVQGLSYSKSTLLLAESMGGNEDIPLGVKAVLTRSATDVLSHAAIRARAQKVLLATCYDPAQWTQLQDLAAGGAGGEEGVPTTLSLTAEGAILAVAGGVAMGGSTGGGSEEAGGERAAPGSRRLAAIEISQQWALQGFEFAPNLVGAKSLNCCALLKSDELLEAGIKVPSSMAIPYGTFERVLAHEANQEVRAALSEAALRLDSSAAAESAGGTDKAEALKILATMRNTVLQLTAPEELVAEVAEVAVLVGLLPEPGLWVPGSEAWAEAWQAICKVWASKWNDRAWLSRTALGIPESDLVMSVLLQQVVPADYAFVLHTADPVTHTPGQLFGEVVVGMGEALVGNYPGRALSFSAPLESEEATPQVHSLPSKRSALMAEPTSAGGLRLLIARSDANGEDLEDLAGAGLYDSVPFTPLVEVPVDYSAQPVYTDPGFRNQVLGQLTATGRAVKKAMGGVEQDVEGVISDGHIWVVQSRPQVMH